MFPIASVKCSCYSTCICYHLRCNCKVCCIRHRCKYSRYSRVSMLYSMKQGKCAITSKGRISSKLTAFRNFNFTCSPLSLSCRYSPYFCLSCSRSIYLYVVYNSFFSTRTSTKICNITFSSKRFNNCCRE